jgi:hypothetical protein
MAQIIKHRRGSISQLKDVTAKAGELVMATGSINDLNGPFIFIGESENTVGGYRSVSKLYSGNQAPTISSLAYGTVLDGTPYYAAGNETLYILSSGGNTALDLTGNIEGNTISGVTINNLVSTNVSASFFTGSFVGDGTNLFNIPASGVTGLNLSRIASGAYTASISDIGGFQVNTDASITGALNVDGSLVVTGSSTLSGNTYTQDIHGLGGEYLILHSDDYVQMQYDGPGGTKYLWIDENGISAEGNTSVTGSLSVSGDTSLTGSLIVSAGAAVIDQGVVSQNSNVILTSGSNLIIQDSGNLQVAGNASITGSQYVDNVVSRTGNQINALHLNGGTFNAPDVELTSAGDISLFAEGGTVNVTGSMRVTGDIIFSGSINLGDYTGDTINFNGEVSSSILPQTGSSFDLGSSGQTWNNVWAENAHFTNISLNSIAFDGLTEGRVVTVGESGSLVDYSGFTFDGDNLYLSGALEVTNIQGTGSLYLKPDLNDSRLFEIYNTGPANDIHFKGNADYNFFGDDTNYLKIDNTISKISIESSGGVDIITSGSLNIKTEDGNDLLVSSSSDLNLEADTDVTITAGDDLRLYSNDVFALRNYSSNDPITLVTKYDSGDDKIMSFDSNGNLTIPGGFTGSFANLSSGATITGSLIVSDGSGLFNSSLIANNSNLTLDNGSNIEMNQGHVYFNEGCGDIYYNTGNDRLTIFNDCGGINLGSSTYTSNNMYFDDGNTLYTNNISGYELGNLNLQAEGGIYLYSDDDRFIQLHVSNDESGDNYLRVEQEGVEFSTYDFTSGLTHKVLLDNTGSLKLENVSLSLTGSLGLSGSLDVYGPTHIHNDLYVSGNLAILGSGSVVHISASQVDIGTNIINLNTYAPFERFAGLSVYDSGSNVGVTGSLLWDSTNNVWIYSHPDHIGSVASARLISGPLNTGSLGNETGLTNGHFPIATGDDHISDSLLTYQGTTLALNTNKFTVDSETGDTLIHGNFTIEGVGGVDNGNYSSYIVFRNDDDVLGFVGTSDTGNVTDRLLGYNSSTGVLEFSSLIDGGTY